LSVICSFSVFFSFWAAAGLTHAPAKNNPATTTANVKKIRLDLMVVFSFLSFFDLSKSCELQLVLLKDWIQKGVRLSLTDFVGPI
jgi:hypothetical protein